MNRGQLQKFDAFGAYLNLISKTQLLSKYLLVHSPFEGKKDKPNLISILLSVYFRQSASAVHGGGVIG
jgi:hypothetical protein